MPHLVSDPALTGRAPLTYRSACGERWAFTSFASRTEVYTNVDLDAAALSDSSLPSLGEAHVTEAVRLREGGVHSAAFDLGGVQRNAVASVVAAGPRAAAVIARLEQAAAAVAVRRVGYHGHASVLDEATYEAARSVAPELVQGGAWIGLRGDVVLGVNCVAGPSVAKVSSGQGKVEAGEAGTKSSAVGGGRAADGRVTVARIVAEEHEDVYRLLAFCLEPLTTDVGSPPYKERLHASTAAAPPRSSGWELAGLMPRHPASDPRQQTATLARWRAEPVGSHAVGVGSHTGTLDGQADGRTAGRRAQAERELGGANLRSLLLLLQLGDSALPTGGFAHSGGLEASLQLAALAPRATKATGRSAALPRCSPDELARFAATAADSASQQLIPFALAAHRAVGQALSSNGSSQGAEVGASGAAGGVEVLMKQLDTLCAQLDSQLAPTAPARRASLQQGAALARVAGGWSTAFGSQPSAVARSREIAAGLGLGGRAHGSVVLGGLAALLELPAPAVQLAFTHNASRDVLSAAVRLNLVGPLAAVSMQSQVAAAAAAAAAASAADGCDDAAGSSPLVDALHSCHDMLERRIFQT